MKRKGKRKKRRKIKEKKRLKKKNTTKKRKRGDYFLYLSLSQFAGLFQKQGKRVRKETRKVDIDTFPINRGKHKYDFSTQISYLYLV